MIVAVGVDLFLRFQNIQRGTQSQAASARNIEAFRKGLRDLGYVEGRNITLEIRYGDGVLRPQSSTQATPHIHLHPKQWTTKPTGATEVLYGAVWLA